MAEPFNDAHCHLDYLPNAPELARKAAETGAHCFCNTVTPRAYLQAREKLSAFANVKLGVGLHPWYVGQTSAEDRELFCELAAEQRFVGEVGLDGGSRWRDTLPAQVDAFEETARSIASTGCHVVSIHAVKSSEIVLDALERTGACESNVCVFHWFSGTSDDLVRARKLGCWFSVGPRMLQTKRGRAYAKAMPLDRLLLETDWPASPREAAAFDEWQGLLREAYDAVAALRGTDAADEANENAALLLR